jgi:rare lipoprotein A
MNAIFGPLFLVALCSFGNGSCCPARAGVSRSSWSSGGEHVGAVMRGEASYYHSSLSGEKTASGERYNPREYTAASRTLPFGTRLRVTRVDTGKSVVVVVNDRGPFGRRRRILDLSRAAAKELDMIERGTVEVEAVVIE